MPGIECLSLVAEIASAADILAGHFREFCSATAALVLQNRGIIVSKGSQPIASPQHQTAPESEEQGVRSSLCSSLLDPDDADTVARILSFHKSRVSELYMEMCPHLSLCLQSASSRGVAAVGMTCAASSEGTSGLC